MGEPESGQATPSVETPTPSGLVKKKFLNGWTSELEDMMADWADKAACYRWMHEKTSVMYGGRDRSFNIPVIILSGFTAGANFALGSIFDPEDQEAKKWAQIGLGGASLITGIIQTLMNFYNYAKGSEAHRVAGISWGKFNRLLCIEMRLHPDERMDSNNFLKMFRIELDRLIEQSPVIPEKIIQQFNGLFKNTDIVKPEITGILQHTRVYKDNGARLKRLAAEATIALGHKKTVIKQLVLDDLEGKTRKTAIEEARKVAFEIINGQKKAKATPAEEALKSINRTTSSKELTEKNKEERKNELDKLATAKAGTVAAIKNLLISKVPDESQKPSHTAITINPTPTDVHIIQVDQPVKADSNTPEVAAVDANISDANHSEKSVTENPT